MNYYYADGNNQAIGPITEGQLHVLGRNGSITPDTQVLQEGTTEWCQYGKILASLPDVMFLTSCTHCGASMEVPDPYRGKNIRCSTCQAEFPAFRPDERPFSFDCPECEGSIEAEPSMSGQAAPCPHCRNSIVIPHPASKLPIHAPPASVPPPPKASAPSRNASLLYICRDGKNVEGPMPADRLFRMVERKEVDPTVMACIAGTDTWKPLSRLTELDPSPLRPTVPETVPSPSGVSKNSSPPTAAASLAFSPRPIFWVGIVLAVVGVIVLVGTPGFADRAYDQKIEAQKLVMHGIDQNIRQSARTLDVGAILNENSRIREQTALVRVWQRQRDEQKETGKLAGVMMLVVGVGLTIWARSSQGIAG